MPITADLRNFKVHVTESDHAPEPRFIVYPMPGWAEVAGTSLAQVVKMEELHNVTYHATWERAVEAAALPALTLGEQADTEYIRQAEARDYADDRALQADLRRGG